MKKWLLVCSILLNSFFANQLYSQSTQDTLKKLSVVWMQALERRDSVAIENFLASDYTLNAVGESDKTDRTTWMTNALDPKRNWREFKYTFGDISIFNDHAIVNSVLTFKVNPIPFAVSSNVIDHWVLRNGKWQVAGRYIGESSISDLVSLLKGVLWGIALTIVIVLMIRFIKQRKRKRFVV